MALSMPDTPLRSEEEHPSAAENPSVQSLPRLRSVRLVTQWQRHDGHQGKDECRLKFRKEGA